MFKEFDHNGNGVVTVDELAAMVASLQISCERKYLQALLNTLDTNKNGCLEFEEFVNFVINDPYK